ncbi:MULTISPECIES: hypothetical protein [Bacillus cereus group]|uniref:hypothetical protein n=1 Tax=Bacillus cereus group TaxID=86661 RepID=UPI00027A0633|nr:hypothetical protein [Bacillus cereus]EJR41423.1 hypothetical protein IIK_05822 [Bacillus cereus VD102]KKC52111.1 hypothetical protein OA45_05599 [Bacillus sp. UMTAT18]MBL3882047.1 hypothetical protein [Bacillus cereus]HEF5066912.1 hypothetical protein [Bacillus cereus]
MNYRILHYIGLFIAFLPVLITMFISKEQLKWQFAIPLIIFGAILMFIANKKKRTNS